jgi:hypothetical protein
VELRRETIERGDFPAAADGLDPEAVAAHLRAVADAVEELLRAPQPSSGGRVQAVVDAAERSAAELEESARADAERTRAEAVAGLERVRQAAAELEARARAAVRELEEATAASKAEPERPPEPEPEPPPEPEAAPEQEPAPEPEPAPAPVAGKPGEAPRLIALNMVLNGASREEVARYLDENFDLDDPGEVLDEVWNRAGA